MLCKYSHTQSERRLAEICTAMVEIQHSFLGDCFFYRRTLYTCHYSRK